jgi:hypothetical protein
VTTACCPRDFDLADIARLETATLRDDCERHYLPVFYHLYEYDRRGRSSDSRRLPAFEHKRKAPDLAGAFVFR